jgi:hypothetical protein
MGGLGFPFLPAAAAAQTEAADFATCGQRQRKRAQSTAFEHKTRTHTAAIRKKCM